jgi:DNA-binding MarR family transcriptional regulator
MSPAGGAGGDAAQPVPALDRLVHEPARLMIMANLYVVEGADFMFLMRRTGLTFGNLSSHLSKLEAAGYVRIDKHFVGKKPRTMVTLTDRGRAALDEYRSSMERVLDSLPVK